MPLLLPQLSLYAPSQGNYIWKHVGQGQARKQNPTREMCDLPNWEEQAAEDFLIEINSRPPPQNAFYPTARHSLPGRPILALKPKPATSTSVLPGCRSLPNLPGPTPLPPLSKRAGQGGNMPFRKVCLVSKDLFFSYLSSEAAPEVHGA